MNFMEPQLCAMVRSVPSPSPFPLPHDSLIAVPSETLESGQWLVSATNNFTFSHANWSSASAATTFKVLDPLGLQIRKATSERERLQSVSLIESTLVTVHQVLTSIQGMESNLRRQLAALTLPEANTHHESRAITQGEEEEDEETEDEDLAAEQASVNKVLSDLRHGKPTFFSSNQISFFPSNQISCFFFFFFLLFASCLASFSP